MHLSTDIGHSQHILRNKVNSPGVEPSVARVAEDAVGVLFLHRMLAQTRNLRKENSHRHRIHTPASLLPRCRSGRRAGNLGQLSSICDWQKRIGWCPRPPKERSLGPGY